MHAHRCRARQAQASGGSLDSFRGDPSSDPNLPLQARNCEPCRNQSHTPNGQTNARKSLRTKEATIHSRDQSPTNRWPRQIRKAQNRKYHAHARPDVALVFRQADNHLREKRERATRTDSIRHCKGRQAATGVNCDPAERCDCRKDGEGDHDIQRAKEFVRKVAGNDTARDCCGVDRDEQIERFQLGHAEFDFAEGGNIVVGKVDAQEYHGYTERVNAVRGFAKGRPFYNGPYATGRKACPRAYQWKYHGDKHEEGDGPHGPTKAYARQELLDKHGEYHGPSRCGDCSAAHCQSAVVRPVGTENS